MGRKPKIIPQIDGDFDDIVKSLFNKDEEIKRRYKKKSSDKKPQSVMRGFIYS